MTTKFYITNAIKYANADPHLGHGYEEIISDTIARYHRQKGEDVMLVTGLDENSVNVYKKAIEKGIDPLKHCDAMEAVFKESWDKLSIGYDLFIRTTSLQHMKAVIEVYNRIRTNDDIYEGIYKGYYCPSCEAYKEQSEIVNGKCTVHNIKLQHLEETNLFFRLSKYQEKLLKLIESDKLKIVPDFRKNEIVSFIKGGLKDLSVTRFKTDWGIDVPDYEGHKFYVWFDALINYLTACGFPDDEEEYKKYWPCDLHVIGKDISRFHCIIWPAMLLSAGIELPDCVLVHGFISTKGEKLSKTKGNILSPEYVCSKYGVDSVRYFLMRETPVGGDVDYSEEKLIERYTRDLANDLGNLVQRTLSMTKRYFDGEISGGDVDNEMKKYIASVRQDLDPLMSSLLLSEALAKIWGLVRYSNGFVEQKTPWSLNKEGKIDELKTTLFSLIESIRNIACFIYPFMPGTSLKISRMLGFKSEMPKADELISDKSYEIKDTEILFPKLEA